MPMTVISFISERDSIARFLNPFDMAFSIGLLTIFDMTGANGATTNVYTRAIARSVYSFPKKRFIRQIMKNSSTVVIRRRMTLGVNTSGFFAFPPEKHFVKCRP